MLLSWFVLTNHCALATLHARLAPSAQAEDDVPPCHKKTHQAPVKEVPCKQMAQCCTTAKASLAGKIEVKFDTAKFELFVLSVLALLAPERAQPVLVSIYDHGPPRAESFAELVLQRSLLSHAPPYSV